jgi:hypothetical protein
VIARLVVLYAVITALAFALAWFASAEERSAIWKWSLRWLLSSVVAGFLLSTVYVSEYL